MNKILFLILIPFLIHAQGFTILGLFSDSGSDTTGNYLTSVYVDRVAGGGAGSTVIDQSSVKNLYASGIDSITLSIAADYGIRKNANNKILTLFDLSTNELDIGQADTSKSPNYTTAGSFPSLLFDGTADNVSKSGVLASLLVQANKATFTFVLKQDGTQAANGLFSLLLPNTANQLAVYCTHSNSIYFDYGDQAGGGRVNVAQPTGWDDSYHIVQFVRHVNVAEVWVDGVRILNTTFSDDLDNSLTNQFYLGTRGADYFKGEIAEVLFTNGVTKASVIRAFLTTKYGM